VLEKFRNRFAEITGTVELENTGGNRDRRRSVLKLLTQRRCHQTCISLVCETDRTTVKGSRNVFKCERARRAASCRLGRSDRPGLLLRSPLPSLATSTHMRRLCNFVRCTASPYRTGTQPGSRFAPNIRLRRVVPQSLQIDHKGAIVTYFLTESSGIIPCTALWKGCRNLCWKYIETNCACSTR
jgi:hypothetical protein